MIHHKDPKDWDEKDWEMVRERIGEELGEQCEECGGQIATDMTPKWVYREYDICGCVKCPECGKIDSEDERVLNSMKCRGCFYL